MTHGEKNRLEDLLRYREINIKGSMSNSLSCQPRRKLEMDSEQLNLSWCNLMVPVMAQSVKKKKKKRKEATNCLAAAWKLFNFLWELCTKEHRQTHQIEKKQNKFCISVYFKNVWNMFRWRRRRGRGDYLQDRFLQEFIKRVHLFCQV